MTRTDCWDGGDDFTELQFVEDGGLTSGVKTDLERPLSLHESLMQLAWAYHQNT